VGRAHSVNVDTPEYGLIDIHTHILPGVDDGAKDFEESLRMIEVARRCGTTDLVASPHSDHKYHYDLAKVSQLIADLEEAAAGFPRIHRGCDCHFHFDNIQAALRDPQLFTINGRGYLLVEFADNRIENATLSILETLMANGMTPVITHPERNPILRTRMRDLRKWVDRGCLLQVTAASLMGDFGKSAQQFAESLMKHDLVHFLASDSHSSTWRSPDLRPAYEWVERHYGASRAERLMRDNPRAAIEGLPLPSAVPESNLVGSWLGFLG
jgi:protein-tyrosine phosphatase